VELNEYRRQACLQVAQQSVVLTSKAVDTAPTQRSTQRLNALRLYAKLRRGCFQWLARGQQGRAGHSDIDNACQRYIAQWEKGLFAAPKLD